MEWNRCFFVVYKSLHSLKWRDFLFYVLGKERWLLMEDGPGSGTSKILNRIFIVIQMGNHHLNDSD